MTAVPDPAHVPAGGNAMGAGPVRGDPGRATGLLTDAERAARSITDEYWKASALAAVAEALAVTDPGRAERLVAGIGDSMPTTPSITVEDMKARGLGYIAEALTASDPGRAERTARSITGEYEYGAWALLAIAKTLGAADPGHAARLIADAERTAQSFTGEDAKTAALAAVAEALAATDPDRAERTAQSITDEYLKASALTNLARAAVLPG